MTGGRPKLMPVFPARPPAPQLPPEAAAWRSDLKLRGQGELQFFGLTVYEAFLWTPDGFQPEGYMGSPFVLAINYQRRLSGDAIVARSLAEMQRIEPYAPAQGRDWQAALQRAITDVGAGDRIVGIHHGDGEVSIHRNGSETARWCDLAFADRFFGIWLSPRTPDPALRAGLLGE